MVEYGNNRFLKNQKVSFESSLINKEICVKWGDNPPKYTHSRNPREIRKSELTLHYMVHAWLFLRVNPFFFKNP